MPKFVPGSLLVMLDGTEVVFMRYKGAEEFICFRSDNDVGKEIVETRKLIDIKTRRIGM